MKRRSVFLLVFMQLLAVAQSAHAQQASAFPVKPVTLVVPYVAGGLTDVLARVLAPRLAEKWGQNVLVENRTGGGTTIGTAHVARAPGDGHTLLMTAFGYIGNQIMVPQLPYDPKALAPLAMVADSPSVLYVSARLPVTNLADFIAWGKASPGRLTFASSGNASSPHIAAEQFADMAGLQIVHVPYRGNTPAVMAVLSGEVDGGTLATPGMLPHVKAGKINALAVTSRQRSRLAPEVPTVAELGLKDLESEVVYVVMAHASTPEPLMQTMAKAITDALSRPELQNRLSELDMRYEGLTGAAAASRLKKLSDQYGRIIRATGMKVD